MKIGCSITAYCKSKTVWYNDTEVNNGIHKKNDWYNIELLRISKPFYTISAIIVYDNVKFLSFLKF